MFNEMMHNDLRRLIMVINLTPDIEPVLNELAEKQGTTIELLVLKTLRQHLLRNKNSDYNFFC
jgi:hypothetical protein